MGEIKVRVVLQNEVDLCLKAEGKLSRRRIRRAEVDAVVDTGAVMTLLPREIVKKLGLRVLGKVAVRLADEQRVELDKVGALRLSIGDREMIMDCLAGPPGCEALVGQLVMEELDLIPDPALRTLTPRPESPLGPTLKMKASGPAAAQPSELETCR